MTKGSLLRFYVHENRQHHNVLLYEWLLEQARSLGIHGGSAFRAIAGYGRHGVMHEEHFFELAGNLTVVVEFIVSDDEAARLFEVIRVEKVSLFYCRLNAEFGALDGSRTRS
jgi:PII-like signaling protein